MYTDPRSSAEAAPSSVKFLFNSMVALTALLILCIALVVPIFINVMKHRDQTIVRDSNPVDDVINEIMNSDLPPVLPTRFVVDKSYWIPPSDQKNRGTCWVFAALFLLESSYRHQGIAKGWLNESEYLTLSKQGYGAWLGQHCRDHRDVAPCKHGCFSLLPEKEKVGDHKSDSLYYFAKSFPDLVTSVIPESVCPYYPDEGHDFECDGMEEAIKTNPLKFSLGDIKAAIDVNAIKQLLIDKQRPLGADQPLPGVVYNVPCADSVVYGATETCKSQKVKCPAGYSSDFCYSVELDARTEDGVFYYHENFNRTEHFAGHAMNVIGYNDDWVYRNRVQSDSSLTPLRGAFIYHNSWNSRGHSIEYLLGRRSDENENVICPNHRMSTNWIPADKECAKAHMDDVTVCGQQIKIVRGKGLAKGSDPLKCIDDTLCDSKRTYVLAGKLEGKSLNTLIQHTKYGVDRVQMFSWDTATHSDFREETFDALPFHRFPKVFSILPENLIANDEIECGYYALPYQVLESIQRKQWAALDNFHVYDLEINWDDQSYEKSPAGKEFDFTLVKKNIHTWPDPGFNGPIPYDLVFQ